MQVIAGRGQRFPWVDPLRWDSPCYRFVKPGFWAACIAPHPYLSGAAISPPASIRRQLRPKDAPPACTGGGATEGPFAHSFRVLSGRTGEAPPVLQEVTPQLADPAGSQAEHLANVLGPPPGHEGIDHAAVALTARAPPAGEVDAERGLVGRRGLGVVAQPLLEG